MTNTKFRTFWETDGCGLGCLEDYVIEKGVTQGFFFTCNVVFLKLSWEYTAPESYNRSPSITVLLTVTSIISY